jgi:hypothetical protein
VKNAATPVSVSIIGCRGPHGAEQAMKLGYTPSQVTTRQRQRPIVDLVLMLAGHGEIVDMPQAVQSGCWRCAMSWQTPKAARRVAMVLRAEVMAADFDRPQSTGAKHGR